VSVVAEIGALEGPSGLPEASLAPPPRLARNLAALLGGQVVTWTMTLVWTLVVPRVLGPEGFGVVTAALSVSGVLAVFLGLGTRAYLVREIVLHPDQGSQLVGTAIVLRLLLAPVVAAAAYGFTHVAHVGHDEAIALYLAALMNVLILLSDPVLSLFQALERMHLMAYGDVINKTAQSLLGILIALCGLGAIGVTANMALVAGVVVALNLVWARRYASIQLRTSARALRALVRGSMSYWATGIFFTLYLWIDSILLSLLTGAKVVGWYGAATTLFQTLMFIPTLISTAWLPRLVEAFKGGPDRLWRTARTPVEVVLLVSAPMAAGMVMVSALVVHVLYGHAYAHAVPVVALLGLCIPPTYMSIVMAQVLVAAGRQRVYQWLMVAATLVNPALNLVLIPLAERHGGNGAIGAAVALLLTELLVALGGVVMVRQVFDRALVWRWLRVVLASGAMWALARLAAPLGAVPAALIGALTFGAGIALLRVLTLEERRAGRAGWVRLRARLGGA
jgi:O-antigen/teichoic acid export membrane protein